MNHGSQRILKMTVSAVCLTLCQLLPFLTGNIPEIGGMLCPMHIPVLLCAYLCGPFWAAGVGVLAPLLRFLLVGMPPLFPTGLAMCLELAAYGLIAGAMYRAMPKKPLFIYGSLLAAMVGGRLVWGAARAVMSGVSNASFTWAAFMAGAITNALPGIVLQIVLIPVLVMALQKALPWMRQALDEPAGKDCRA